MKAASLLMVLIASGLALRCGSSNHPLSPPESPVVAPAPSGVVGTGAAGTSAAGTGAAGTSVAGTGVVGTGAAGTGAAAGSGGPVTDAGHAPPTDASAGTGVLPECSTRAASTAVGLPPAAFCMNFLATCAGLEGVVIPEAYASEARCEATYAASTKQACQSYHLCGNAFGKTRADRTVHCPHAFGMGPCAAQ